MQRRTLLAGLTLEPLAAIAYAREAFRGGRESSLTSADREAIRGRYFPNVVLTTHLGKEVRFYDDLIKGKIVTINFMFTILPLIRSSRSEEHTSELQSQSNLVCRLLLEKKKRKSVI